MYCQSKIKITEISLQSKIIFYREIGRMDFPMTITGTLQGSSVTQGNPVTFTAITFAVRCPEQLVLWSPCELQQGRAW